MSTQQLIENLQHPSVYDHAILYFKLIETHISWVLLTGHYAYKIKKPVDFQFLDFSTLEKRKFYCEEELRLGKLFAQPLYIEVVPICGTVTQLHVGGQAPIIEYAIKMREFSQDDLLSELLKQGRLTKQLIEQLAESLANFHDKTPIVPPNTHFGLPQQVHAPAIQNFSQMVPLLSDPTEQQRLERLRLWTEQQFMMHQSLLSERKRQGLIRECHGDLHLANIVLYQQTPFLFDRLEFNENLRWTDTLADLAFLAMDLMDKQQPAYANQLINTYLIHSNDYLGLAILPYYLTYRAMVRAKVSLLRIQQADLTMQERQTTVSNYRNLITLAERYTQPRKPILLITHGFSGSGKTTVVRRLVAQWGAIQLSSDVQRKRLFNSPIKARTEAALYGGIYSPEATEKTYQRLHALADRVLRAGYPVIVDASFLKRWQRELFYKLARCLKIPYYILHCQADYVTLASRIEARLTNNTDPSEARLDVLLAQQSDIETLSTMEQQQQILINTQRTHLNTNPNLIALERIMDW